MLLSLGVESYTIALDRQYETMRGIEWDKYKSKINKIINIIQPYAKEISIIYDTDMNRLLNYKDSPTDKGEEVFMTLFENREII